MIVATEEALLGLVKSTEWLDPTVRKAWKAANHDPRAFHHFMKGLVAFNFYAAPSATQLAANLKLMDMNDAAAEVFAALPDEYGKFPTWPDHRTLALGLLSVSADYAKLTVEERSLPVPEWHKEITDQLQQLYQGRYGDRAALIRAIGAHWASERLADKEYADGDRIIRHDGKGRGLDRYLRETYLKESPDGHKRYEMKFGQWAFDPWEWIQSHGAADDHAAEFQHFLHAQNAVNIVLKQPEPDSSEQVWHWICEGAQEFADLQNRFFCNIAEECESIMRRNAA